MNVLTKIGISLVFVGLVSWGWIAGPSYYRSRFPLKEPLPLAKGGVLRKPFSVRTQEQYILEVDCEKTGPLAKTGDGDLGAAWQVVTCDLQVRIRQAGEVVFTRPVESFGISGESSDTVHYYLAELNLPGRGDYELEVVNSGALPALAPAHPQVVIRLHPRDYKVLAINASIGNMLGGAVGGLGLLCILGGLFVRKKPARPSPEQG